LFLGCAFLLVALAALLVQAALRLLSQNLGLRWPLTAVLFRSVAILSGLRQELLAVWLVHCWGLSLHVDRCGLVHIVGHVVLVDYLWLEYLAIVEIAAIVSWDFGSGQILWAIKSIQLVN